MNERELIILAGGKGTRLGSHTTGLPKILSMVRDRPFLHYMLNYYLSQGVTRFIFSLGHASQPIIRELESRFSHLDMTILVEDAPLDTGGAMKAALSATKSRHVFVANGDTYFNASLDELWQFHLAKGAECSLALTCVNSTERYGRVIVDENGKVSGFKEKTGGGAGCINGGIYLMDALAFLAHPLPTAFSLEKDYLQSYFWKAGIFGLELPGYFIDIGIPEDLIRVQTDMPAL